MKNSINKRFILILPILAFMFYGIVWQNVNMTAPDTIGYMSVMEDISDGQIDNLNMRTPGYPLLLLLTGSSQNSYPILFYVQLLIYILSVIALSSMLYELNVSKKLIVVFSIISLLPYNIVMTTVALTESLTVFTIVFGFYFLFKWFKQGKVLYIGLSAVFFAYAAITRPTYQLIFFVFVFILIMGFPFFKVYKKKFVSSVLAIGISSLIIIGSLFYINYKKFNYIGLTPIIGFNLCNKTVSVLERLPNKYETVKKVLIKHRNKQLIKEFSSHTGHNYIWQKDAIPELKSVTSLEIVDLSNYLKDLHLSLIIKAPRPYFKEVSSAIAGYWLPYIKTESIFGSKILMLIYVLIHFSLMISFFLLLSFLFGNLITSFILKGSYKFFKKNDEFFLILISVPLVIIFYTMLISALFEAGDPRFRTVNDLLIYFFIFSVFSFIKDKVSKNKIQ